MRPVARVEAVKKTFYTGGQEYPALRGVSLSVAPGELVMLAGPSGCGKTTLLSILGGVLRATSGSVEIGGEEITALSERELNDIRLWKIGFIFQAHNLLGGLSAAENVSTVLRMRGWAAAKAAEESHRLLEAVNLGTKTEKKPSGLSIGEQQRVAIARAMAGQPGLLLADEPTAALDAQNGQVVMALLQRLARQAGSSVLVVTHDNRIHHYADRILHMEDGRVLEEVHQGGEEAER